MSQVSTIGTVVNVPALKSQYSGRLMVSSCDISGLVITGYEEVSRYVSFDAMTLEEVSKAYSILYGAKVLGMLRENRERLKKWTKKSGFDFVRNQACNSIAEE